MFSFNKKMFTSEVQRFVYTYSLSFDKFIILFTNGAEAKENENIFLSYSTNKGLKYLLPDPHDNMIASAKLFNKNKKTFIYCVWTLTVSEWLTLLLLHPEEQNQAAEEKQGTHDHSWGQESLLLGGKMHTWNHNF